MHASVSSEKPGSSGDERPFDAPPSARDLPLRDVEVLVVEDDRTIGRGLARLVERVGLAAAGLRATVFRAAVREIDMRAFPKEPAFPSRT